jgi:hypothetical protein
MQKRQERLWVRPMRSCFQSNIRRSKLIFNTSRSSFLEYTLSQPHVPEMAMKFYWRISLGLNRIENDTSRKAIIGRQLSEGTAGNPEHFGGGSWPIFTSTRYSRATSLCFIQSDTTIYQSPPLLQALSLIPAAHGCRRKWDFQPRKAIQDTALRHSFQRLSHCLDRERSKDGLQVLTHKEGACCQPRGNCCSLHSSL